MIQPWKKEPKYEDWMPNMAYGLLSTGRSLAEVASALGIDRATFWRWRTMPKKYGTQELCNAVNMGEVHSEAYFDAKAREALDEQKFFNTQLYSLIKRNRFGARFDEQPIKLPALKKAKTFTEQINYVLNSLRKGDITPSEAKKVAETVAIGAKVEEATELKRRLEELETHLLNNLDTQYKEG